MRLTEQQGRDPLWALLKAHIESRIAIHRAKNDSSLSPEQTEKLRGRIDELKYLLSLDKPAPPQQAPHIES